MFSFAAIGAALRRIPGWVYVLLILVAGGWYYGHTKRAEGLADGRAEIQAKWDAQKAKDAKEIERLRKESGKVTERVVTKYVDRERKIYVAGQTIVKQVPVYVSRDLPDLPPAVRWLHDHAAQGSVPGSAVPPDVAPVAPQDLTATVADNYTQCLATAEQLRALQEWVTEQKRLNP